MPSHQITSLQVTLNTFRSVLANHQRVRSRLVERRAKVDGEPALKLDRMLAINEQTSSTLARTIHTLETQLAQLQAVAELPPKASTRALQTRKNRKPPPAERES